MDPVSTFALAGTVLTFVDCGCRLFKYTAEIYKSANGSLASADCIERYASEVVKSINLIKISQSRAPTGGPHNAFGPLLDECNSIAEEICTWVEKLRKKAGRGILSSLKKAVLSMVSSGHIEDLLKRLEHVREEVVLRLNIVSHENVMAATNQTNQQLKAIEALLSERPKELGYPWETGPPKDHVIIDDGLDRPFILPFDLCSTRQTSIDILRLKYASKNLPGRYQMDRGHFSIWDWSETRRVSTDEDWQSLITEARRLKLAFAMSTAWGRSPAKCLRCRKPGMEKAFNSKFKTCKSCGLSQRHVEPSDFPCELQDLASDFQSTRYRDHVLETRSKARKNLQPNLSRATQPATLLAQSDDTEPLRHKPSKETAIDLVAHRVVVKWEPMMNIVHRYGWCRCIVRMTSPASCEKEMTLIVLNTCPRHNSQGVSFSDYGNQDYHSDPYFDRFGGYDMFKFLVSDEHVKKLDMLSNEKFMTQQEWLTALFNKFLGYSEERRREVLNAMEEYWLEIFETAESRGAQLTPNIRERLRERRQQHKAKLGLDLLEDSDEMPQRFKLAADKLSWVKEVNEILAGKWNGKLHWAVEE
ncbi:hypothetical protein CONLIGDRAFT_686477 [Coniochaeta ligniaria NRRL 30616]|uniref:Ubiquitin-like domain-containing protein n=1 Tax=Coniochaeta ligniaria NRRL 30616 TaxID=1408157 RepID=A0A1J7I803_9PEZI|nr:hypothetical protein CONLIGDRAFT_686477 [Coniochaeta ligniaria NRRL 30616]